MYDNFCKKLIPKWIPTRGIICIMLFTACFTNYVCRLQMPILAISMINTTEVDGRDVHRAFSFFSSEPFYWSSQIRGQLIAAYGYGNLVGNLLGGIMALQYGPRRAILWSSLVSAAICLMSPILAQAHYGALILSRIIVGLAGGVTFPACHSMVARWAPPNERSRFVWSLQGGSLGTIIAMPMVSSIAAYINWETGWYFPSLLMFVWIAAWALLAYDSPGEHPFITKEEKEYILTEQESTGKTRQHTLKETPVLAILTSFPFLCLIICHFGNLFILSFYQNSIMLYLTQALGFSVTNGGLMSALPPLGRMLFGFFFSFAGDTLKRKKLISLTALRKTASIFSHLVPGVFLILLGFVVTNQGDGQLLLANIFLTLAFSFNGAAVIVNLSNNQDLSPNYAGFLYGLMNTIGSTAGIIGPILVEAIAGSHEIEQWQKVFCIGAGVCFLSMIIFILGGSGNVQKWNDNNVSEKAATESDKYSIKKNAFQPEGLSASCSSLLATQVMCVDCRCLF
ncbi:sialin-like isoform X1 [Belonocnema kinseyi]|uniref:sialin-like isoform X1 n=1 Tax=Belonocnema kinseyi TaxID=2817044 RepID=UPI00143D3CC0|nr:sialin-like isoform X1 [Belonocnema kinseyi]